MLNKVNRFWKRIRLFIKLWWGKKTKHHKPIISILHITANCNLNCGYCFSEHKFEIKDPSFEQWKYVVDELKEKGCDLFFLQGGEPLLYKDLETLIDYIKNDNTQVHLTTNGLLIPQKIHILKKVDLVMVSLDGNKKGNDANRGEGSFEKITRGIETAIHNKIPLRINCVLTKNNVGDIEWLLDYAKDRKVFVGFSIPAKCGALDTMGDKLDDSELIEVHKKLLKLKTQGKMITLCNESLKHIINYPKQYHEVILKSDPDHKKVYQHECIYGRYLIFVTPSGNIYPCPSLWEMPDVFTPKNIFKDGFDMALENAQNPKCWICYVGGGVEWNFVSSFRGLLHSLKFARSQL